MIEGEVLVYSAHSITIGTRVLSARLSYQESIVITLPLLLGGRTRPMKVTGLTTSWSVRATSATSQDDAHAIPATKRVNEFK